MGRAALRSRLIDDRDYNYSEIQRSYMYPKQEAAIFDPRRYSLIEASTKAGKTSACLEWIWVRAMALQPGQNAWWVAPVTSQADMAFDRMARSLRNEQENGPVLIRYSSPKSITLHNEATITFKSADKPDSLYGEDVYAMVIDEASRVKEGAWHACRSTLTYTRGPVRIIGNVKGRKNWFYQLARKAEKGDDPEMGYHKMTAYDATEAGVLDQAEIEDARRTLPEHVFNELYLAIPSDDGGNPFGIQAIADCIGTLSPKKPKWFGWDLGKRGDWTVGIGLDDDGRVAKFERFRIPWGEAIDRIHLVTAGCPALVDSTGLGDPVVDLLQKKGARYEGFNFSASSKQRLMEGLAVAIQQRAIRYPDGVIRMELEQFEYEHTSTGVRYSAPAGYDMHDDCVMALALAVMHKGNVRAPMRITQDTIDRVRAGLLRPKGLR